MAVIVYSKKSSKSGRLLGKLLNISAKPPKRITNTPDVLIRWGCSSARVSGLEEIQPRDALGLAANKRLALNILMAEGVPIPGCGEMYNTVQRFPVYMRTDYHTKGRGLWYCNNEEEVEIAFGEGGTHWLEAITEPRTEYRIHVGRIDSDYRILYRQRKYLPPEETRVGDTWQDLVRNFGNGWRFSSIPRVNRETARAAKAAVSALGLDFGAVDVIRTENGQAYVLEINTAPALVFRGTIMAYVRFFEWLLGIEADPANVETIIQRLEGR